ncbi:MAG: DUF11 domain-containing protein, partial [Acidimicrobiales bacterium]|nr:DUF11 domain-containing protein [Acidimicrobiales bacterium]
MPTAVVLSFALLARLLPAIGIVGLVTFSNPAPAAAHSVAQVDLGVGMTSETKEMLINRGTGIQPGDVLGYVITFTAVNNGSLNGPGGYVTFYPPPGTQVVGAAIVQPEGSSFRDVPVAPPGAISGRAGKSHAPYAPPFDANDPNNGGAWEEGTLPQFYGDTGIFYSQSAATAKYVESTFQDGSDPGETALTSLNGYLIEPSACKQLRKYVGKPPTCKTHNLWDASNVSAWGGAANTKANVPGTEPHSTYPNLDGKRGRTAYLAGSPVAGPDTFYRYDHTAQIGPWQRIAYPGSTIGVGPPKDRSKVDTSYKSTSAGITLDEKNPLPADTTAVRWAVGGLSVGELKHVKVDLRVLPTFNSSICTPVDAEVFGGDAGVEKRGKDNAWRYHVPSPSNGNTCLALHKSGPSHAAKGDKITYTIIASNVSATTLTGVRIEDALPAGMRFVSASPTPESTAKRAVKWPVLDLAPGESVSYEVTVKIKAGGTLVNTTTADSDQTHPVKAGNQILVGPVVAITHAKSVSPAVIAPGEVVTYTLEITNSGDRKATAVSFVDTLDPSLSYVPGSTLINGAKAADPTGSNPNTWTVGTIAGKSTATVQFDARMDKTSPPGVCYRSDYAISWSEASVRGRQTLRGVETAELCLDSPAPVINVTTSGPAAALVGDTITNTFEVVNDTTTGDGSPINNLTVTDNITGSATLIDGDTNNDNILQTGETWNYTTTHTTTETDVGDLITTVTITGNDTIGQSIPPTETTHITTVSPPPNPDPVPAPTEEPELDPESEPDADPAPTQQPELDPESEPDPVPAPTQDPEPQPDPDPVPAPTQEPEPEL